MYIPNIAEIATTAQYADMGTWQSNNQNGIAAKVPKVPGALGARPLPKPKANIRVGERRSSLKLGFLFEMRVPSIANRHRLTIKQY